MLQEDDARNPTLQTCQQERRSYTAERRGSARPRRFYAELAPPGAYQANPPYDATSMLRALEHVCATLEEHDQKGGKGATSFVVVIPQHFRGPNAQRRLAKLLRPWRRHVVVLQEALFNCGFQHRPDPNMNSRDFDATRWVSKVPIQVLWLQNAAGHRRWPPTPERVQAVVDGFGAAGAP